MCTCLAGGNLPGRLDEVVPRLVVVPTPIGNLEDITLRAVRTLREVSLILAEDTRHTAILLRRYAIHTPLLSYHQHNKRSRLSAALEALEQGDVALVSSAGMPSIADPGFELISSALEVGIEVDVLPGPTAVATAVVLAALPAPGFMFIGFPPRKAGDRRTRLAEISSLPYSLVLYEAPHRLLETLTDLRAVLGDRRVVVARELTKVHQETIRGTLSEAIEHFQREAPRGECTLVVAGAAPMPAQTGEARNEMHRRCERGEDARTAMADVARTYKLSRNDAYKLWLAVSRKEE